MEMAGEFLGGQVGVDKVRGCVIDGLELKGEIQALAQSVLQTAEKIVIAFTRTRYRILIGDQLDPTSFAVFVGHHSGVEVCAKFNLLDELYEVQLPRINLLARGVLRIRTVWKRGQNDGDLQQRRQVMTRVPHSYTIRKNRLSMNHHCPSTFSGLLRTLHSIAIRQVKETIRAVDCELQRARSIRGDLHERIGISISVVDLAACQILSSRTNWAMKSAGMRLDSKTESLLTGKGSTPDRSDLSLGVKVSKSPNLERNSSSTRVTVSLLIWRCSSDPAMRRLDVLKAVHGGFSRGD